MMLKMQRTGCKLYFVRLTSGGGGGGGGGGGVSLPLEAVYTTSEIIALRKGNDLY